MKTLDEIKDDATKATDGVEYAEHLISDYDNVVVEIAVRFAAEQNQQMKADILELRAALDNSISYMESEQSDYICEKDVEDLGFEIKHCQELLTKTAHYGNQKSEIASETEF